MTTAADYEKLGKLSFECQTLLAMEKILQRAVKELYNDGGKFNVNFRLVVRDDGTQAIAMHGMGIDDNGTFETFTDLHGGGCDDARKFLQDLLGFLDWQLRMRRTAIERGDIFPLVSAMVPAPPQKP